MSLLMGKAINWAAAVWKINKAFRTPYEYFTQQIRDVFEHPAGSNDVLMQLLQMS